MTLFKIKRLARLTRSSGCTNRSIQIVSLFPSVRQSQFPSPGLVRSNTMSRQGCRDGNGAYLISFIGSMVP